MLFDICKTFLMLYNRDLFNVNVSFLDFVSFYYFFNNGLHYCVYLTLKIYKLLSLIYYYELRNCFSFLMIEVRLELVLFQVNVHIHSAIVAFNTHTHSVILDFSTHSICHLCFWHTLTQSSLLTAHTHSVIFVFSGHAFSHLCFQHPNNQSSLLFI